MRHDSIPVSLLHDTAVEASRRRVFRMGHEGPTLAMSLVMELVHEQLQFGSDEGLPGQEVVQEVATIVVAVGGA